MAAAARNVPDHPAAPDRGTAVAFLRVAGRLHARVEDALAPLGVTYRQFRLLASLRDDEGADAPRRGAWVPPVGGEDLALELERRGLVRRAPCGVGSTRLRLTVRGAACVEAAEVRLEALVADFGAPLDLPDAAHFGRLLGKARTGPRWSTRGRA